MQGSESDERRDPAASTRTAAATTCDWYCASWRWGTAARSGTAPAKCAPFTTCPDASGAAGVIPTTVRSRAAPAADTSARWFWAAANVIRASTSGWFCPS
ncbi:MAG: hypothetical protein HOQ05_03755 [Corynebacteriales bacterium]|nr:hypothetical protein [Mycobacteriales bacterium]